MKKQLLNYRHFLCSKSSLWTRYFATCFFGGVVRGHRPVCSKNDIKICLPFKNIKSGWSKSNALIILQFQCVQAAFEVALRSHYRQSEYPRSLVQLILLASISRIPWISSLKTISFLSRYPWESVHKNILYSVIFLPNTNTSYSKTQL